MSPKADWPASRLIKPAPRCRQPDRNAFHGAIPILVYPRNRECRRRADDFTSVLRARADRARDSRTPRRKSPRFPASRGVHSAAQGAHGQIGGGRFR